MVAINRKKNNSIVTKNHTVEGSLCPLIFARRHSHTQRKKNQKVQIVVEECALYFIS